MAQALAQKRHGVDTISFAVAAKTFQDMARAKHLSRDLPRGDEILLLFLNLCKTRLVVESERAASGLPLFSLAIPVDDVAYALQDDADKLGDVLQTSSRRW